MKKSILAICDLEEAYVCNLAEYMNQRKNIPFEVQAFTDPGSLAEFVKSNHVEVLLISTEAMSDEVKEWDISRIIILSEGEYPGDSRQEPYVCKYQASDHLIAEVMNHYAAAAPMGISGLHSEGAGTGEILAVYSPLGRVGKTTFAIALGEVLAEKKKVLYLNLEDYHGFEGIYSTNYRADLSDLIYFARQKEGNLVFKLNSMVQTFQNLDYIPPAFSPSDLRDVSWQEWMGFFKELLVSGGYEVLILDMGTQMEERYQMLRQCRRVYLPVLEDHISQSKLLQFEKNLCALDCGDVLEKISRLHLPEGNMGSYVRRLLMKEGME